MKFDPRKSTGLPDKSFQPIRATVGLRDAVPTEGCNPEAVNDDDTLNPDGGTTVFVAPPIIAVSPVNHPVYPGYENTASAVGTVGAEKV